MSDGLKDCPFCGGGAVVSGDMSVHCAATCEACGATVDATSVTDAVSKWNRRADLAQAPAPVRVKPLIFSEFTEGGCMGRPHPFQYFITQAHNGRFLCHHDETWHDTLEAAQAHAQAAYQLAALEAPDAGMVAELVEARAEIATLRARLARMEEALQPFADAADESDEWGYDDDNQAPVTAGQCRDARAALTDGGSNG